VSSKTIRRNIDILSSYYPIVAEREGREITYGFSHGYKYQSPTFTPAELASLLLAQEAIAAREPSLIRSPFANHGQSLLEKVRASLPASLRQRLDVLASIFGSAVVPAKDFTPYAAIIDRLTVAAMEGWRVRLQYHTLTTDKVSTRKVDPYAIYFDPDGATLKLVGYDDRRKRILPFSIDRIRSLKEMGEKFSRPASFNLKEYLTANCFNGLHGELVDVRLRGRGVIARVFDERVFHPSQRTIERTPKTSKREETTEIISIWFASSGAPWPAPRPVSDVGKDAGA
jgi:predicted DNA-binding transcriptional regulator YafY